MPRAVGQFQFAERRRATSAEVAQVQADLESARHASSRAVRWLITTICLFVGSLGALLFWPLPGLTGLACACIAVPYAFVRLRRAIRHARFLAQDYPDVQVDDYFSPGGERLSCLARSGKVIYGQGENIPVAQYIHVRETGTPGPATHLPSRLDEIHGQTVSRRALSPSELEEIRGFGGIPVAELVLGPGFLLGSLLNILLEPITRRESVPIATLVIGAIVSVYLLFHWRSLALRFAFRRDMKTGYVFEVDHRGNKIEVLPSSKLVWSDGSGPAAWRQYSGWSQG